MVRICEDHDKGHGRIEKRTCTVNDWLGWFPARVPREWLGLRSIVRLESHSELSDGRVREDTRYHLSSLEADTARHLEFIRGHRAIENGCHWVLDMVFHEDQARARCGDAVQNLSTLRRITLNQLKNDKVRTKESIRGNRIYAALDPGYLKRLVGLPLWRRHAAAKCGIDVGWHLTHPFLNPMESCDWPRVSCFSPKAGARSGRA